jgi:V8-like Glu-specific endopeptidase
MTKFSLLFILTGSLVGTQAPERRKDIPAIARDATGCIVSIIMSDKDGHPVAQGSGFLIGKDGRVVTNYHVIENGTSAIVKLPDGAFFVVDGVLASDKDRDVAVIKAHGENFRTLKLGNSDRLQVGEQVVAIGNPLSLESTVSSGIVSGIRTVREEGGKFLQVTTPISPGSSGGPLFNMAGEVIGITTLYLKGGENLNFAIPINDVKPMLVASHSKLYGFPDEPEAAPAKTAATADGASLPLKDTLNWINNFARIVPWNTTCLNAVKTGNDIDVKPYPCTREYLLVSGEGCTVTATVVKTFVNLETGKSLQPDKDTKEISTIPLKELDPEQIRVIPYPFNGKGETRYSVEFSVADESWKILKDFKMIDGTAVRRVDGTVVESFLMREDSIVFPQEDDAKRFAGAFKNAVELCGGKHLF